MIDFSGELAYNGKCLDVRPNAEAGALFSCQNSVKIEYCDFCLKERLICWGREQRPSVCTSRQRQTQLGKALFLFAPGSSQ